VLLCRSRNLIRKTFSAIAGVEAYAPSKTHPGLLASPSDVLVNILESVYMKSINLISKGGQYEKNASVNSCHDYVDRMLQLFLGS
jgi:hypothetical protein